MTIESRRGWKQNLIIQGATALTPDKCLRGARIVIRENRFADVQSAREAVDATHPARAAEIDAHGLIAMPALINAHDHFRGSWLPRCGNPPYENVYQWLAELHQQPESAFPEVRRRDTVDNPTLYQLGAYKNIFSGAATALDHYMRTAEDLYAKLPLRMIGEYGRESLLRAIDKSGTHPSWGWGAQEEFQYAQEKGLPFVIHCEEGFDAETREELPRLAEQGLVNANTLLVHCIGCDRKDYAVIAASKASVAWCPATYEFLYQQGGDIRPALELGVNVALGTDSCLTGSVNMIDELRVASAKYQEWYGETLPSRTLLGMATVNAARALKRDSDLGRLEAGYCADLLLVRAKADDPYDAILSFDTADIDLLMMDGKPLLAAERHGELFDQAYGPEGWTQVNAGKTPMLVIGDPAALRQRVRDIVGGDFNPAFLPFA
ncbi:amidohydrolase family protein [Candidatus Sumerlaeota bacterium]|nr:amidohydrolase family protein [Candidatus Sumerlaeota bacterium]